MENKENINNNINIIKKNSIKTPTKLVMVDNNIFSPDYKHVIVDKFIKNVKGKEVLCTSKAHCGSEGHWLENQMGIKHNSINEPDLLGYEMKKSSNKITFGDFSASEYLFSKKKETIESMNNWEKNQHVLTREEFITYFGSSNPLKNNRYSWSGKCVPRYGIWNYCGQKMIFNDNLDLCIYYSYEMDSREEKDKFPMFLKTDEIVIAIWEKSKLEQHINKKFNKKGFFICKKNKDDTYEKICFGKPFDFQYFVENVKNKNIIFDSGMYVGNSRNYSQFRSSATNFWNNLIIEEY